MSGVWFLFYASFTGRHRLLVLISGYILCTVFLISYRCICSPLYMCLSTASSLASFTSLFSRSLVVSLFLWFLQQLHVGHVGPYVNINNDSVFIRYGVIDLPKFFQRMGLAYEQFVFPFVRSLQVTLCCCS